MPNPRGLGLLKPEDPEERELMRRYLSGDRTNIANIGGQLMDLSGMSEDVRRQVMQGEKMWLKDSQRIEHENAVGDYRAGIGRKGKR